MRDDVPPVSIPIVAAMLVLSYGSPLAAQQPASDDFGAVSLPVSCAPEVQADFDRAVALLHHMMYDQSRALFTAIAEEDPDCAMARWGIATTLFQPLWPNRPGPDALARGHRLVEEARSIGAGTGRERALIEAAAAFYRDPETAGWWTRIRRWAAAMDSAHEAHPEDREVRAFWALSRLALAYVAEEPASLREQAAGELRAIWETEPRHPGAVHYTIHANDVAGRAGQASEVVASYGAIAPSVAHALHMPTHIYVRTAEWPKVVAWNRRSADAALEHPVGGRASHHHVHAADYLVYAYLQQGRDAEAREVLREVGRTAPYQPTFPAAFHLSALEARWAVERRDWSAAAAIEPASAADLDWNRFPWPEGIGWYARGLGALHAGELAAARSAVARLGELRERAEAMDEAGFAAYLEIDRLVLAAYLARAEERGNEAVRLLRQAVALEEQTPKHPISPGSILPPAEALGEVMLSLDRPEEARTAFRASLDRWPGRYRSLLGAARAARGSGDRDAAEHHYRALLDQAGDSSRPGIEEARSFLERPEEVSTTANDRFPRLPSRGQMRCSVTYGWDLPAVRRT